MGYAVGVINPKAPFVRQISDMSDEISWFVNYITAEGLLYLNVPSAEDHQIAPARHNVWIIHGRATCGAVFDGPLYPCSVSAFIQCGKASMRITSSDCGARMRAAEDQVHYRRCGYRRYFRSDSICISICWHRRAFLDNFPMQVVS